MKRQCLLLPWRRPGFTLVELLTVTAVLTILAGLLLPVLGRAREVARRSACLARMQQIGQAYLLYVQDWDEQCPPWLFPSRPTSMSGRFPFVFWPPAEVQSGTSWTEYLQPYLRSTTVLYDPGRQPTASSARETRQADYALLTWGPGGGEAPDKPYWRWAGPGMVLSQVPRPAETLLLVEGFTAGLVTGREAGQHGDGANSGFIDGHVRWLRLEQFQEVGRDGEGRCWLHYAAADR